MSKKLAAAITLLTVLCFSLAGQALAQTGSPGVEGGDYFTFSINTHWNTTNSSHTVPEYLVENNNTKWYNVSVSYVSGANVTATNTWEYNNGTTGNSRVEMEVNNGTVYFAIQGLPAFQGFFPADLNMGDPIRPLANNPVRVNETVTREYAGVSREVNVVTFSYQVTDYSNSSIGDETLTFYIDKATGVLVERIDYTEFPDQTGSLEWKLTETNVWGTSTQPMSLLETVAIIAVIAIIVVIVMYLLRGRRQRRH